MSADNMPTAAIQPDAGPWRSTAKLSRRERAYRRLLLTRVPSRSQLDTDSLRRVGAMDKISQGRIPVVRLKEGATRSDQTYRPLLRRSVADFNHIRHTYNNYSHYRMDAASLVLFPPIHSRRSPGRSTSVELRRPISSVAAMSCGNDVTPILRMAEHSDSNNDIVVAESTGEHVGDKPTENANIISYKLHGSSMFQRQSLARVRGPTLNGIGAKPSAITKQQTTAEVTPRPRPATQGGARAALTGHKATTPRGAGYDSTDEYLKKSKRLIKYYADPAHQPRTSPVNHSCFQPLRTRERRHPSVDEKRPDVDDLRITSSYVVAPSNERLQVDCHEGALLLTQRNLEIFDYLDSPSSKSLVGSSGGPVPGAQIEHQKNHEAIHKRVLSWVRQMSTAPSGDGFDVLTVCNFDQPGSDRIIDTLEGSSNSELYSN